MAKNRNKNVNVCPLDEIKQSERIRLMSNDIISGMSLTAILDKYERLWKVERQTVKNILDETIVNMSEQYKAYSKDNLRAINTAKAEELWADATTGQKIRILDLINRLYNLYEENVNVNSDDTFKFDISVKSNNLNQNINR